MRIIDFHSHFFARPFFETLAKQAGDDMAVSDRLDALALKTGIEMPLPSVESHLARWVDSLDAAGVEHLCTFASLPEEASAVAEAVALAEGRLSGFALVNPRVEGSADKLAGRLESGQFRGALLFPAMHHFDVGGEEAEPLLCALDDLGAVVFVHCGLLVVKLRDHLGLPRPYDLSFANPLSLIPAANRHRNVRFVIPHFGAGFFRETLMAGTQCENIYVDTSSSNSWIATQPGVRDLEQVFRESLAVFGAERVLFGTDSNVFPAGWRADRLEEQLRIVEACGVSDADRDLIFAGNAARLLELPVNP
jgi:predicted TIM-barrel fold metal-dependent hydrolase